MVHFDIPTRLDLLKTEIPDSPADRVAEKRRIRKHQVLDIVRRNGPLPRVEIARLLGFNLPSVSSLVDDLLAEGLATEEKAIKTAIGRRPIPVVFNPAAASLIGIDIGRTTTIGLLMDLSGSVLCRLEKASPVTLEPDRLAHFLEGFMREMIASCQPGMPPLAGVGIGLPGVIFKSRQERQRQLTPAVQRLRDHIAGLVGVPVIIDNDARMMAYGALRFGNAAGNDCMAIVNLGFGLGVGLVINGTIFHGYHGHASELGHSPFGESGVPCYCGLDRCLENIASGSGLERMARQAGISHNGHAVSSADLADLARTGDAKACCIFERFSVTLAQGLGALLDLFNPKVLVLAGRVSRAADVFQDRLFVELAKVTVPTIYSETELIVSDLFENAGPMGACACVLHHIFSSAHISVESIV